MERKVTRREFAALAAASGVAAAGLALRPMALAADDSEAKDASAAADGETREFTDSLGRTVQVPKEITAIAPSGYLAQQVLLTIAPEKFVVVASALTEDQAHFIGEQYEDLEEVGAIFGSKGTFNREAAAASGAQIVIDVGEVKDGMADDLDDLQDQLGIPCVHVSSDLATYADCYKTLGELLGVEERGDEIADYCKAAYEEISAVMESIPEEDRTGVLYLTGEDGLSVLANSSYQANVVDMCCNNLAVVEDVKGSSNETSMEQIALWDADFILFAPESAYDLVADDETWKTLRAIDEGSYCEVPSRPFNWLNGPPSVNQVLGMQWLPRMLYPEQFEDDMYETVAAYYKTMYQYDLTEEECDEIMARAVPVNQQ